jgi:hypothetical protein
MDLLGMELASLAGLDQLNGIVKRGGPVEALVENFPDKGTRRGVVAALSSMDVREELPSFF